MSSGPEVITIGEPLVALVGTDLAPLWETTGYTAMVTGAEVNVAVGLSRLGHRTALIGRTGTDAFGQMIHRRLRGEGIDDRLLTDGDAPTGLLLRNRSGGFTEVAYRRDGAAGSLLGTEDVEGAAEWISGARWLHITGVTPGLSESAREAVAAAVERARAADVGVGFDVNYRAGLWSASDAAEALRPLLRLADVVFANPTEAGLFAPADDAEGALRVLTDAGAGLAVVREGAGQVRALGRDGRRAECTPPQLGQVVDPVGAGDAFAAGFTSAWLRGEPLADALVTASTCGALSVTYLGDVTGLPDRPTLNRIMAGSRQDVVR